MRRRSTLLPMLFVLGLTLPAVQAGEVSAGASPAPTQTLKTAPDFTLPGPDGASVTLQGFRGRPLLINFWASWCEPCVTELPHLEALAKRFANTGLQVLAINLDPDRSSADDFLKRQPLSLPVAFDTRNTLTAPYGISAIPSTVLIDADGRIVWEHRGYSPGDEKRYAQELEARLRPH